MNCEDCNKLTSGNCGRPSCIPVVAHIHNFVFSGKFMEATEENIIYHEVGYSVCSLCGEVRKNDLLTNKTK